MSFLKKSLLFFVFAIAAILLSVNTFAEDNFARANIYAVTEHEKMSGFDMDMIERTSAFGWTTDGANAPKQKYENGLPGYVLLNSSQNSMAEYFSAPTTPINAFEHRQLSFAVRIKCGDYETFSQSCSFILTLISNDKTLECTGKINSGIWNVISFDISTWKYRQNITSMSIAVIGENPDIPLHSIELSGPYVREAQEPQMEKFMAESLSAPGTEIEIIDRDTENEALRIDLNSKRINVSGNAAVPYMDNTCNAVRIIMSNDSKIDNMQFTYTYLNPVSGGYVTATKNIILENASKAVSYLVSTGDVSKISSFSMIFDSARQGYITLHSIEPVALYESKEAEAYGNITKCEADSEKRILNIAGSVFHSFLISHNDYTLVCYKLGMDESFEDIISKNIEPIESAKMSSKFSFEIKLNRLDEYALISKYAVAARSQDGELALIGAPICVKGDFGTAETALGRTNIKGLNSEYISNAVDFGVGTAIIDVYLDKLTNTTQSGHLYTIDDTFIYFDADYVAELDSKVKNLYAAGCKVYLRLLISAKNSTAHLSYASVISNANEPEYLAVDIGTKEAEKHFFATVDYLSGRYSENAHGKITGLVLGRSVDQMYKYNYSNSSDIISYAKSLARALETMARTAVISIPDIQIVLPISDERKAENGFESELLLISLGKCLDENGGLEYSLMLEGTHIPYSIGAEIFEEKDSVDTENKEPTEQDAEKKAALTPATWNSNYYCTDNLYVFENMLSNLASYSDSAPKNYIYHWSPNLEAVGNGLSAAYIYNYYSIMFSEKASSFILSLPSGDIGKEGAKKLAYLMKYIDTGRNQSGSLSLSALDVFGAESWGEIIAGYNEELITYRVFYESEPLAELPESIKGSYTLWDFSSAFGTLDWFAGNGCRSVNIDGAAPGGSALSAEFDGSSSSNSYSDIVYKFEYPDDISLMPYVEFDINIEDGNLGAIYEIMVIIGGGGHRIESKKVINSGKESKLIISTSHEKMEHIDYVRISLRRISGNGENDSNSFKLYLRKVKAYSNVYDNSTLSQKISEARAASRNTVLEGAAVVASEPNHDFIIAMVVIIILAVAIVGFYDRRQK